MLMKNLIEDREVPVDKSGQVGVAPRMLHSDCEAFGGAGQLRKAPSLPPSKTKGDFICKHLVLILHFPFLNFVSRWFCNVAHFHHLFYSIRMENKILSFVRELLKKGD